MAIHRLLAATAVATVLSLGMAGGAHAFTYTGSLAGNAAGTGTLITTGTTWSSTGTGLSWTVTNENGSFPGLWVYNYTFAVPSGQAGGISHVITELSAGVGYSPTDGLLPGSVTDASPNTGLIEVKTNTAQQGNPGMPASVYGIKINTDFSNGDRSYSWQLVSNRAPMWGNFYAKGGGANAAWNAGFTLACADPYAVGNGNSCLTATGATAYKALVPDTTSTVIPIPAALPLMLTALAGLGLVARRRSGDSA